MGRLTDTQLFNIVYEYCVKSETKKDYIERLKELSEKTHKTEKYLDNLLEEYEDTLTKEKQTALKQARKRHQESKMTYKKYVEQLLKMSDKELEDFIQKTTLSKMKGFFDGYVKKINEPALAKQAEQLFEKIKQIYLEKKEDKKNTNQQNLEEEVVKILETMTSNGYFDYTQFKREFSKVIGISEDELYKLYDKSRKTLRKINIEKYEEHKRKLEENRIKTFMQKKEKIIEMLKLIPDHYDIIDYYINMQMEVDTFIKLCKDFITQEEQVKITIFFSTYINKLNNEIKFPTWKRIEKDMIVNNEVITVELEEFLLREMERLKIPTNYFILFLQKYKNGTLDLEQTKIKS